WQTRWDFARHVAVLPGVRLGRGGPATGGRQLPGADRGTREAAVRPGYNQNDDEKPHGSRRVVNRFNGRAPAPGLLNGRAPAPGLLNGRAPAPGLTSPKFYLQWTTRARAVADST